MLSTSIEINQMARTGFAFWLIFLISHSILSAAKDLTQPSVYQPPTIGNDAVNLTLPGSFEFTVDRNRYTVNDFKPRYTRIFAFYRFLVACLDDAMQQIVRPVPYYSSCPLTPWLQSIEPAPSPLAPPLPPTNNY